MRGNKRSCSRSNTWTNLCATALVETLVVFQHEAVQTTHRHVLRGTLHKPQSCYETRYVQRDQVHERNSPGVPNVHTTMDIDKPCGEGTQSHWVHFAHTIINTVNTCGGGTQGHWVRSTHTTINNKELNYTGVQNLHVQTTRFAQGLIQHIYNVSTIYLHSCSHSQTHRVS